jgi:hypothetical protein
MKTKAIARTILRYEIAAFSLLVVLSWADELLGVPALLFYSADRIIPTFGRPASKHASLSWSRSPF